MLKGISLYTGLDYTNDEIKSFFLKIKDQPIDFIFTSFHINEAKNPDPLFLLDLVKGTNKKLVVDFSKKRYDEFGFNDSIIPRLDYGFSIDNICEMLKVHDLIELNASVIDLKLLLSLKERGVDFNKIRVSFNFYPKPLTGMSISDVRDKIKLYHEFGLLVIIYIPCKHHRGPLYLGLPTIEDFRNNTFKDNLEASTILGVDGICVGDSLIDDEELDLLLNYDYQIPCVLEIPFTITKELSAEEKEILKQEFVIRNDESPYVVRSSTSRGQKVKPHNQVPLLKRGSVVIDNELLLRYSGELSIIKKDLNNPGGMNLIGEISINPDLIKGGAKIRFKV